MAINTARNLLESGNIDQTLKKSIEDSKKRYQIYYSHQKKLEKESQEPLKSLPLLQKKPPPQHANAVLQKLKQMPR